MAQARRRVGAEPLRWLFDLLRGPAPGIGTAGVWWRGLLVCAIDGTTMAVPDSRANLAEFTKHRCNNGGSGYPALRLLVLVSCGTRTVIDAVFGPTTDGETTYAPRLLRSLHEGMIVLLDRNFAARTLVNAMAKTGAHVLVRVKNGRRLPVLARCGDGSYLSAIGDVPVRVIDCEITITTAAGRRTGLYRLVTTLTDHKTHPAAELITLSGRGWWRAGGGRRCVEPVGEELGDGGVADAGGQAAVADGDRFGEFVGGFLVGGVVDTDAFAGAAGGEDVSGGFPAAVFSLVDGSVAVGAGPAGGGGRGGHQAASCSRWWWM